MSKVNTSFISENKDLILEKLKSIPVIGDHITMKKSLESNFLNSLARKYSNDPKGLIEAFKKKIDRTIDRQRESSFKDDIIQVNQGSKKNFSFDITEITEYTRGSEVSSYLKASSVYIEKGADIAIKGLLDRIYDGTNQIPDGGYSSSTPRDTLNLLVDKYNNVDAEAQKVKRQLVSFVENGIGVRPSNDVSGISSMGAHKVKGGGRTG